MAVSESQLKKMVSKFLTMAVPGN
uniref:Tumor susceptibility protein isoform 3 n=1 Tax=Homo sapiens TaxID=9606 RepID=Q86SI0_HUMAN|nr:tumor susceptibility protein isoform 3 [Homo sapiens]AAO59170.1 tumor susceptibility protein isoform 4 [Homo sapiens]